MNNWMEPGCYQNYEDARGFEDVIKNLPVPVSKKCYETGDALLPRYLFKYREKKNAPLMGHCTHCGSDMNLPTNVGWKHDDRRKCPVCGHCVYVKDGGRSRKYLIHSVYLLYYYPGAEPETVTAAGVYFSRNYSGDFRTVKTEVEVFDVYFFRKGQRGAKYTIEHGWLRRDSYWKRQRECNVSKMRSTYYGCWHTEYVEDRDTAERILDNADLKSCCIKELAEEREKYKFRGGSYYASGGRIPYVTTMDIAMKYPCVEYLYKMGQTKLLMEKIHDRIDTRGIVNWQGRDAQKVLKMGPQEFREVKADKIALSTLMLKVRFEYMRMGKKLSMKQYAEIAAQLEESDFNPEDILNLARRSRRSIVRVLNYVKKQSPKCGHDITGDLSDYWNQCATLEMDISKDDVCFPSNFMEMHNELSKRITYTENKALDKKIKDQLSCLSKKFCFEHNGLVLRPFECSWEIINEGNMLHHCVGGYVERYAEGGTVLCCLRKAEQPNVPYHTVEFGTDGHLKQCRGYRNTTNAEDRKLIDAFWKAFNARTKKKSKKAA